MNTNHEAHDAGQNAREGTKLASENNTSARLLAALNHFRAVADDGNWSEACALVPELADAMEHANEACRETEPDADALLTSAFGRDVGLNADWATSAWHVGGDRYIMDEEDGYFSLVCRSGEDVVMIRTVPAAQVSELIAEVAAPRLFNELSDLVGFVSKYGDSVDRGAFMRAAEGYLHAAQKALALAKGSK